MKYIHNIAKEFRRATFAINPLPKKLLVRLKNDGAMGASMQIGVALVHPKDQFNKKIGRTTAVKNVASKMCILNSVKTEEERTTFDFSFGVVSPLKNEENMEVVLGLSIIENSDNVHVEYCFIKP